MFMVIMFGLTIHHAETRCQRVLQRLFGLAHSLPHACEQTITSWGVNHSLPGSSKLVSHFRYLSGVANASVNFTVGLPVTDAQGTSQERQLPMQQQVPLIHMIPFFFNLILQRSKCQSMMANPILRKLFKEFGDMVRRVARDDRIRVLVVRSANDAWRGEKGGSAENRGCMDVNGEGWFGNSKIFWEKYLWEMTLVVICHGE